MINKITKLKLPQYVEFIIGVLLVIVLITRYSTSPETLNKFLLVYIVPSQPLFLLFFIFLFLVAARLIAGKPKDYSRFFYHLLVKFDGRRKRVSSNTK